MERQLEKTKGEGENAKRLYSTRWISIMSLLDVSSKNHGES